MSRYSTLEERATIVALAEAGKTDKQISMATGWCERMIRRWRLRAKRDGRSGLQMELGRPKRGGLSSYATDIRNQLVVWRRGHPGWGPNTLWAELKRDPAWAGHKLPSPASIGRFLKETGLSRAYETHSALPQPNREEAQRPHQRWQLDARGHGYVPEVGVVSLVHLNDCASHLRLLSYPVWLGQQRCQRHPDTADYQTVLRLAWTDWGLPETVQVDHDSVFIDTHSQSPFPTRLHLWLVAMAIQLVFSRPVRPTDQAMTERSHQLWAGQCVQGQTYTTWNDLYWALRQRRDFLNYDLPCASLNHQPPLVAFPQARHSGRPYRPEWEANLLDLSRVWAYLAQGRWFRKTSKDFTFSLGAQVYYIGRPWHHAQLDITFDPADHHLVCRNQAGDLVARLPIQGLSIETLMGDLCAYTRLPMFQLALPFDWADCQLARFFEIIPAQLIET